MNDVTITLPITSCPSGRHTDLIDENIRALSARVGPLAEDLALRGMSEHGDRLTLVAMKLAIRTLMDVRKLVN